MKITIYTITDCQYCKALKEYLAEKNLPFEEKNVQTDKTYLSEMLEISGNFAGVPFSVIDKDGGEQVKIKGFTQSEFDEALMTGSTDSESTAPAATEENVSTDGMPQEVSTPEPATDAVAEMPTMEPATLEGVSAGDAAEPASTTPDVAVAGKDELDGLLQDLQSKVEGVEMPSTAPAVTTDMPAAPTPMADAPVAPTMPEMNTTPTIDTASSESSQQNMSAPAAPSPSTPNMEMPTAPVTDATSAPVTQAPVASADPSTPDLPDFKTE